MSGVKAGIMLSAQYFEGADMVSALQDSLLMVRLARDRGWDSDFCGQHYLNEGGNQGLQMVPYLARLAADGRIDLDAPIQKYVPGYPQKEGPPLTVRLLVSE